MVLKKKRIIYGIIIIIIFILFFILGSSYYIETRVAEISTKAMDMYKSDKINSLISLINNGPDCNAEKAQALWALGQLGSANGLNYLTTTYALSNENNICNHEAKFAIQKLEEKSFNLPGWLWRWTWDK